MESLTKQREIIFDSSASAGRDQRIPYDDQAKSAVFLLAEIKGVLDLKYLSETQILITYDIRILSLDIIHQTLEAVGFQLDESLISKIKNALCIYTESTLRENLGVIKNKVTRDIFMHGYQKRLHGCRDLRSTYWRYYL